MKNGTTQSEERIDPFGTAVREERSNFLRNAANLWEASTQAQGDFFSSFLPLVQSRRPSSHVLLFIYLFT